jgi:hypothetical protein
MEIAQGTHWRSVSGWSFTTIAQTDDFFHDFSPYVPAINNHGSVAFQATNSSHQTGIYIGSGNSLTLIGKQTSVGKGRVVSHPTLSDDYQISYYFQANSGKEYVVLGDKEPFRTLSSNFHKWQSVGPLGPTMNHQGTIAFRATTTNGKQAIFCGDHDSIKLVAEIGDRFSQFHGLPVIHPTGSVLFRADLCTGGQGIFLSEGSSVESLVVTSQGFQSLGLFPAGMDASRSVFAAIDSSGKSGIVMVKDGMAVTLIDDAINFQHFRGALMNHVGEVVFFATSPEGKLGIYGGPDPIEHKILAVGDLWNDSTITEFALNPVSINRRGDLAIRIRLADGQQAIVRAEGQ